MSRNKKYLILFISLCVGLVANAAMPVGYYYLAKGKKKAELKTTLHEISAPLYVLDYGSGDGFTWQGFYKADRNPDNTVKDMYSNIIRSFNGFNSIPDMAIEHSFPKSWWGGFENTAYKDLFHLYPADAYTNGIKNNLPLGEVTGTPILDNGRSKVGKNGFQTAYTDNCFEPADEFKGDFARSYLYIASIYENMSNLWNSPMLTNTVYPVFKPWAIDLLLKWHRQDPVSQKEIARNDSIYDIQSNRNPFIDHPELAEYIWGNDTTAAFTYPEETGAFLISPRRMTKLDFGVILVNAVKTLQLSVQGVNITSPVNVSFAKGKPELTVSANSISQQDVLNGYNLKVTYSPTSANEVTDTLLLSGGGLTAVAKIPVRANATSQFIVTEATDITPVSGVLHWLNDPLATQYQLSVYQGDKAAGDLIISGYYEGASNDKAIEIFNGTGNAVNLSDYLLKKQTNGAGDYVTKYKLSGTLQNNKTCVVVYTQSANSALRAKANFFADSVAAFNGNDAVALYRNGVPVDIVGKLNGGADYIWGLDKFMKRKPEITHPSMHFDTNEWTEYPYADIDRLGTHTMNLTSTSNYSLSNQFVGQNTSYPLTNLEPDQRYTYKVTSYRSGALVPSYNTMQFKTEPLEIPMALDASHITSSSFVANWDVNPYVANYYLDVYSISGQVFTTVEDFNNIGSTGKPLPAGWTGTASGNYATTASSGISPNSIALKTNGEWLQTPTYSDTITSLNFMCRFPSAATGSFLKVEAQNQTGWEKVDSIPYINTSKYYPTYAFSAHKGYTAIKFTYSKAAGTTGNIALDDVDMQHGTVDTVFVVKNTQVTANQYLVQNLKESNDYYYTVRAAKGAFISEKSNQIKVSIWKTNIRNSQTHRYKIGTLSNGVVVLGLEGHESIKVYSVNGMKIFESRALTQNKFIPLENRGFYLVVISNKGMQETLKIVK